MHFIDNPLESSCCATDLVPIFENQSQTQKKKICECKRKGSITTCLTGGVPQRSRKYTAGHDSVCYSWCSAGVKEECTTCIKEQEEGQTAALTFWFQGLWNLFRIHVTWLPLQQNAREQRLFQYVRDATSPTQQIHSGNMFTFPLQLSFIASWLQVHPPCKTE